MRFLVVGGGTICDKQLCEEIKTGGYDCVIAADRGMDVLYRHHLTPNMIVGDFDSVEPEVLSFYKRDPLILFEELSTEKDDTDLEHAIRCAVMMGAQSITVMGAIGTRMDQTLASVGLLGIGLMEGVEMVLLDANNRIRMLHESCTLSKDKLMGKYISLLPYAGDVTGLTLSGFKYPLQKENLSSFSTRGVSNEAVEEELLIVFDNGILLVIESKE